MVKIALPTMLLVAAGSSCAMAFTSPALMPRLVAGKAGTCTTRGLRSGVRMMALPEGWQQVSCQRRSCLRTMLARESSDGGISPLCSLGQRPGIGRLLLLQCQHRCHAVGGAKGSRLCSPCQFGSFRSGEVPFRDKV